jgi:hypothetical protein
MVSLNWCRECEQEQAEWQRKDLLLMEAWRCKHCKRTLPSQDIPLMQDTPKPGTYECAACRPEKVRATTIRDDRLRELDHADSREHSEWWDRERRIWDQ